MLEVPQWIEKLNSWELPPAMEDWAQLILLWIGFGTLIGLVARLLLPGSEPGGALTTLAMGIGGVVLGCSLVTFLFNQRTTPLSPFGAIVGTLGALLLLLIARAGRRRSAGADAK